MPIVLANNSRDNVIRPRAFDLDVTLRRQYAGKLRPDAPAWAFIVCHVEHSMTPRRIEWSSGVLFSLMPYCLHPTEDQRCRIIVNRRYKPIGVFRPHDWVDYRAATDQHITVEEFQVLFIDGVVNDQGYLHHDGTTPRESSESFDIYREKLRAMLAPWGAA